LRPAEVDEIRQHLPSFIIRAAFHRVELFRKLVHGAEPGSDSDAKRTHGGLAREVQHFLLVLFAEDKVLQSGPGDTDERANEMANGFSFLFREQLPMPAGNRFFYLSLGRCFLHFD
jgi:hypothetical protein